MFKIGNCVRLLKEYIVVFLFMPADPKITFLSLKYNLRQQSTFWLSIDIHT